MELQSAYAYYIRNWTITTASIKYYRVNSFLVNTKNFLYGRITWSGKLPNCGAYVTKKLLYIKLLFAVGVDGVYGVVAKHNEAVLQKEVSNVIHQGNIL